MRWLRQGRSVPGSLGEESHLLAPLAQLAALRHAAAATRGAAAPPRGPQKVEQRRQQQPANVGTQPVTACVYPRGPEKIIGSAGSLCGRRSARSGGGSAAYPTQRWPRSMVTGRSGRAGPLASHALQGRHCSPCGGTAARPPPRRRVDARRTRASAPRRTSTRAAAARGSYIPRRLQADATQPVQRAVAAAAATAAAATAAAAARMVTADCVQLSEY